MGNSKMQLRTGLIIGAALVASVSATSNRPEFQKAWNFEGKEGTVEIKLTRYVNDNGTRATSLHISSPDAAPHSVQEEAEFLASVLDDLPNVGVDCRSLDWISFRFNEPEAIKRVATSAALSKQWRGH